MPCPYNLAAMRPSPRPSPSGRGGADSALPCAVSQHHAVFHGALSSSRAMLAFPTSGIRAGYWLLSHSSTAACICLIASSMVSSAVSAPSSTNARIGPVPAEAIALEAGCGK